MEEVKEEKCMKLDCQYYMESCHKKWNWSHFWIGIVKDIKTLLLSPEVWVFAFITLAYYIFADKTSDTQWITYVALGACFMFFKPLSVLINNAKLNIEAKVGASLNKEIKENK